MKTNILFIVSLFIVTLFCSCDHVENPYPKQQSMELDTTLYPGKWSDYLANEWPVFSTNSNTKRNVLIEDFTGHKCVYCPAAADLAHLLHKNNPERVFVASIHAGPQGKEEFQSIAPPDYPTDFTNIQGLEIGTYFGANDGGFSGNPRGTVNRVNTGNIFVSPAAWTNLSNSIITTNDLKVNLQTHLNYFPQTKGAFLHVEIEKMDPTITSDLAVVTYLIEDSLVGDQKMSDNTHNHAYIHRDIHRGNIDGKTFGRILNSSDLINGKYYLNYSFKVPNQLDGVFNASNMHLLVYVYDRKSWEIFQVVKQPIIN